MSQREYEDTSFRATHLSSHGRITCKHNAQIGMSFRNSSPSTTAWVSTQLDSHTSLLCYKILYIACLMIGTEIGIRELERERQMQSLKST